MSIGNLEMLSQRILVGIVWVGRLGALAAWLPEVWNGAEETSKPQPGSRNGLKQHWICCDYSWGQCTILAQNLSLKTTMYNLQCWLAAQLAPWSSPDRYKAESRVIWLMITCNGAEECVARADLPCENIVYDCIICVQYYITWCVMWTYVLPTCVY